MEELASLICREGYNFSAATGGPVAGPEEAAQSFQVARELLRRAFFYRKGILISADLSGMLFMEWRRRTPKKGRMRRAA